MKFIKDFLNSGTAKQQKRKRLGALLISITAALLVVALLVLAVFGIVGAIKNRGEEEVVEETGDKIPKGYTTTTFGPDQTYNGPLLLLDASHPYRGNALKVFSESGSVYRATSPEGESLYSVNGMKDIGFTEETINAFNQMMVAFYQAKSTEGYVAGTLWIQNPASMSLNDSTKAMLSAGYGIILTDGRDTAATIYDAETKKGKGVYAWLYENAAQYGFIQASTAEGEENIFRYVGLVHAKYMVDKNLSVADYLAKLSKETGPGDTLKYKVDGVSYEIYYIAPTFPHLIPEKGHHTVSGDNAGGYIITVNKTAQSEQK